MKAVLQTIRILVIILLIENARCQDGLNNGDVMRYQQIASNDGQIETITAYTTNIIQRDPNSQSISAVSVQYRMSDDSKKNEEFNRADRSRSRKVYHIKNPYQQVEDAQKIEANSGPESQDSGLSASNQYAAMQFSLPSEQFLQQMRAENQFYQQQQQLSTPAPNIGYTATPQPQYQYSTMTASNYDNSNQQSNKLHLEPKPANSPSFISNSNYQYNAQNTFSLDNAQSTPSPVTTFLSTSVPNSQFVATPSNTYVSSSSPVFLPSPSNMQQYVSSPMSPIQVSSSNYGNRVTSTMGSNSNNYDNDQNKKMQIDHYDNSANGVRFPVNMQQYQNEYPSSTSAPSSSPFSDPMRESWQNSMNTGINALSKSLQEMSLSQYQNFPFTNNQQDTRIDSTIDSVSSDTHRIGTLSPVNNLYLNYMQSDYNQALNNLKNRPRELQQESPQQDLYSNGDYGWKLTGKKPLISQENYPANYQKYTGMNSQPEGVAVSQMNFHIDTGKSYSYDQNSKPVTENNEAQEFAKAAAKAQENMKQQQLYANSFANFVANNQNPQHSNAIQFYDNEKQKNKYPTGISINFSYSTPQPDLITASPYYYGNSNENSVDNKPKQPFDHAKALKNIVPIDVSNVVQNSEAQLKALASLDTNNRFNLPNLGKDQSNENLKQFFRPISDAYYKDKNTLYGFNLKTKPDDFLTAESFKQLETTSPYLGKQQQSQDPNNVHPVGFTAGSQTVTYTPQLTSSLPENMQSFVNFQQQGLSRHQNQMSPEIANLLKLNDGPYRLTQSVPNDALKLQNNNFDQAGIPTPLPMRINQNLGSHQLDVTSNMLNKLILNKQPSLTVNRPEMESVSTINGYKVVNPYNVDLKLFAEMLKGKPAVDERPMLSLKDQFKTPIKIDLSQLQMLLRNENAAGLAPLADNLSALSNPYIEMYNNGRFPYQGVKYSRSQEEAESIIPIADGANTHPIGAVMDQDDTENESEVGIESDTTAPADESYGASYDEERTKKPLPSIHKGRDRHRHLNGLLTGRHPFQRKYPANELYPLLKPPPPQPRNRGLHKKNDKYKRPRRLTKPKIFRILKSEALFESDDDDDDSVDTAMPILLRPPPPVAEDKSDSQ